MSELIKNINDKLGKERIIHYDYIEDYKEIERLYSGAKAFVYISDREAFGLPPMEALSFGVPPIIMDNELGHELFNDYAFYSKSGNQNDIADIIRQVLTSNQKVDNIKTEGHKWVKKYSWESFADRFFRNIES